MVNIDTLVRRGGDGGDDGGEGGGEGGQQSKAIQDIPLHKKVGAFALEYTPRSPLCFHVVLCFTPT